MGAKVFISTKDYDCAVKVNDNFVNPRTSTGQTLPVQACDIKKAKLDGNVLELAVAMKEAEGY